MNINISKKMKIGITIIVALLCGIIFYLSTSSQSSVEFVSKNPKVEIHTNFKAEDNIKKVKQGDKNDVKIDTSKLDVNTLGIYPVKYTYKKDTFTINISVVDSIAPSFTVKQVTIDLGATVNVETLVGDIQDETKTKVYFKDHYTFDKEGQQEVIVVVEDQGKNKTEKKTIITVVKDKEKPSLQGIQDISIKINSSFDPIAGVVASDNLDPEPIIEVSEGIVNIAVPGKYTITYIVKDRTGNKNQYTRTITVVENKEIGTLQQSNEKVVFLTFDDGPSANTAKVLDVLDRYGVKATFFVTGNGQNYNYLIQEANKQGHTIGLHTYCHNYATVYQSADAYFADLDKIGKMVEGLIGKYPKYIRFPGGSSNTVSRHYHIGIMSFLTKEVQNRGFQYYDWNVSSGDASGNNIPTEKIIAGSTNSSANNVMILMHDTDAKSTTVEALPAIIENYQSRGYRFAGIDDNSYAPHHGVNN